MNEYIIDERDDVGVYLVDTDGIPKGHKFALRDIKKGEKVKKYGYPIGRATKDIKKGEWVHSHNLQSALDEQPTYSYEFNALSTPSQKANFLGYKRKRGRAGIRNEIYIIPTVGCVNDVCIRLAKAVEPLITGSIDGVYALTHQFGCSQLGEDNQNVKKLLCSIALNPNATFVLFVGLGCENNQLQGVKDCLEPYGRDNIVYFNCQDVEDEHEYGLSILKDFIQKAKDLKREEIDFSELCIGLKCGGSDGFSGITANPLVGKITDKVISFGGSAILTEVPEMFGAEQILMNKCADKSIWGDLVKMIEDFKGFYKSNGFPVYENPSPGNKQGGITTLEEKSLGCVQKAGKTKIVDVLPYAKQVEKTGVSLLNAPGNDLIAATALAASGCQIVLFTTGRGTPFSTFVPTMKISTNDNLSTFKSNWIDFNAYSMDDKGLFDLLLKTINGNYKCKSEDVREIAFYKTGVTL
ncbi:MAG: altronate dehydratase [Clostridia bacterium]|nr:altronate dehydratase [Clostridia bacterium]